MSHAAGAAAAAAEQAARQAYGRLLALLCAHTRDIALAEDALADAFERALTHWPRDGVPDQPAAWLLTVARRRALDAWRHAAVHDAAAAALQAVAEACGEAADPQAVPDERLRLLFVCAHPAIDAAARAPLMLQCVLGLDVQRMASAFLTAPATMGQRLARAKTRIRQAGIAFASPEAAQLPARLRDVLDALYAAYGTGWDAIDGSEATRCLAAEAIALGRLLCQQLPQEPEAAGLLALMLFCEARHPARRDAAGRYVPLDQQATALWQPALLAEAETVLSLACRLGRPGPFQIEAAIQSAHTQRRLGAPVPAQAVLALYDALLVLRPNVGAAVGRACALAQAEGAAAGLQALDALAPDEVAAYQPYWAARAHLLAASGRDAGAAYARAIGLATQPAVRTHLQQLARHQAAP
ncbi:RNA polymerase sigma factor [Pseudorhodoferax sp.]|uniref:RNA polymerase sigma factor n=1 Tax=Pseudorhodoferax sp. TaxID=1993553 RepID=UPI002DD62082|nr:DUF6596 domain-containing protein [Pseudorhodoferax sp.]